MEPLLGAVDLRHGAETDSGYSDWLIGGQYAKGGSRGDEFIGAVPKLDWVVVGGESGQNARPLHPDWARSLRDQCAKAGVPFLFKQWGEWEPFGFKSSRELPSGKEHCEWWPADGGKWFFGSANGAHLAMVKTGKKAAGRLLDGKQHDGYPKVVPHG